MKKSRFKTLKNYFRLFKYGFSANRFAMSLIIVVITIVSIIPFINHFLDSKIIDEIVSLLEIEQNDRVLSTLFTLILIIIGLSVIEKILWAFFTFLEKTLFFDITDFFNRQFLSKAIKLDINHYENQKTNTIIQKAKDVYHWRPRDAVNRLIWIIADVIEIIASVAIVLNFSIIAFLIIFAASIPSLIANFKLGKNTWGIWDADTEIKYKY
ncbi:MAG: hypothetical protein Kow0081_0460 [Candidatus Dojkabacteria bacterium]